MASESGKSETDEDQTTDHEVAVELALLPGF